MSMMLPEIEDVTNLSEFEEPDIPCEIPSIRSDWQCGPAPAEWIAYRSIICSCGIVVRLVCDGCKNKYQYLMARHAYLTCATCGIETKGFDRFERLEKS